MTKTFADECLERAEKAQQELYKITEKPKAFSMSIPPQKHDSDIVLDDCINDCKELAIRLKKACKALRNGDVMWGNRFHIKLAEELEAPLGEPEPHEWTRTLREDAE